MVLWFRTGAATAVYSLTVNMAFVASDSYGSSFDVNHTLASWLVNPLPVMSVWCSQVCGTLARNGLRSLFVFALVSSIGSAVLCLFNVGLGRCEGRWRSAVRSLEKKGLMMGERKMSGVSTILSDAGLRANLDERKTESSDTPDVGDSCVMM